MAADYLHLYQCRTCKSTATTAVKLGFRCPVCSIGGRYGGSMAYLWSTRITTDEQRELAKRGIVATRPEPLEKPDVSGKRCALRTCHVYTPEADMVQVAGIGKFCSQAHAAEGQKDYEAFLERLRKLKEEQPWLEMPKTPNTAA